LLTIRKNKKDEDDDYNIDPLLKDYFKILESKALRRLNYKTQVWTCPTINYNIRTRRIHTDEVEATAIKIASMLNNKGFEINLNLCMAGALGHDIGHTPYGHEGERVLSKLEGKEFKHYIFSVIVAQSIERKGKGLNLTAATLETILNHSSGDKEMTINKQQP